LTNRPDGTLALDEIRAAIKPDDAHFARTKLIALENTIAGKVLADDYLRDAKAFAKARGLALHLDGARLFNAAGGDATKAREIADGFDTVSVCLSKGLGTPAGSLLCGSREKIAAAHRWRKMLGGGMRQAGILAAAGLYALEHNIERLAEDHANAARLAAGLAQIPGIEVEPQQTNMVFVHLPEDRLPALAAHLAERGVKASLNPRTRLVTHLDVDAAMIDAAIAAFDEFSYGLRH
jgi:threonine aldolase